MRSRLARWHWMSAMTSSGILTQVIFAVAIATALVVVTSADDENDPACGQFQQYLGYTLFGSNTKTVRDVSVEVCIELCRNNTSFLCLSLDYNSKRSICYLSRESHNTKPSNFGKTASSDYYALVVCQTTTVAPATQECCMTSLGNEYAGQQSETVSGYTCQRWDAQRPHPHRYNNPNVFIDVRLADSANYCRNPARADMGGPWCLTTDPDIRWEYCQVDCPECADKVLLTDYLGSVAVTRSGLECQRWSSNYPHDHGFYLDAFFPDGDLETASNFCRNPTYSEPNGPWCFTTDPDVEWETCNIPAC